MLCYLLYQGIFLKEGILSSQEQLEKVRIITCHVNVNVVFN